LFAGTSSTRFKCALEKAIPDDEGDSMAKAVVIVLAMI
jgi:hypothetical protein